MPLAYVLCFLSLGLSSPSGPCLPGYYCTSEARVPNPVHEEAGSLCPAGHYCPPGSSKPEPCPAGTFLPQAGMVHGNACVPCPAGRFCQGEGLASVSGVYCVHLMSFLSPRIGFLDVLWLLKPNAGAFLPCRNMLRWVFLSPWSHAARSGALPPWLLLS